MTISQFQVQVGNEVQYLDLSGLESIYKWEILKDSTDEWSEVSSTFELWCGPDFSLLLTSLHFGDEPETTRRIGRRVLPEEAVSFLTERSELTQIQKKHLEILERQVGKPLVFRLRQPTDLKPCDSELAIFCEVLNVRAKNLLNTAPSNSQDFHRCYRQFMDAFEIVVLKRQLLDQIRRCHQAAQALRSVLPFLYEGLKSRLKNIVFDGYPELVACVEREAVIGTLKDSDEEIYKVCNDISLMDQICWPRTDQSVVNEVVQLLGLGEPTREIVSELSRFASDDFKRRLDMTASMMLPKPETPSKIEHESEESKIQSDDSIDEAAFVTPDASNDPTSTEISPETHPSSELDLRKSNSNANEMENNIATAETEHLTTDATEITSDAEANSLTNASPSSSGAENAELNRGVATATQVASTDTSASENPTETHATSDRDFPNSELDAIDSEISIATAQTDGLSTDSACLENGKPRDSSPQQEASPVSYTTGTGLSPHRALEVTQKVELKPDVADVNPALAILRSSEDSNEEKLITVEPALIADGLYEAGRTLVWGRKSYELTRNQFKVVRVLFDAYDKGQRNVSIEEIKKKCDASALDESLAKVFIVRRFGKKKTNPVWNLIESESQGLYRLKDPKQV